MRTAILAGGLGTRLQEETSVRPKPMVEIGGRPILWHIMKIFNQAGFSDFVIALGYKGELIKDYFINYRLRASNLKVHLADGSVEVGEGATEDWTVDLIDTGLATMTGGRVKRVIEYLGAERVMLTYGDGLANVDLHRLLDFHQQQKRLATVLAVRPPARFGGITLDGDLASHFEEKPQIGEGWINGGFFVLEPEVADFIDGDDTVFEREPLERIAREGQLAAFRHEGFWACMDTMRDLRLLETLWESGNPPWRSWT